VFIFGRSELIWRFDRSANELPPPFSAITYLVFGGWVAWDGIKNCQARKAAGKPPCQCPSFTTFTAEKKVETSEKVEIHRRFDNVEDEAKIAVNERAVDLQPGTEPMDKDKHGNEEKGWFCGHCGEWNDNREAGYHHKFIANWFINERKLRVDTKDILMLSDTTAVCENKACLRVKKAIQSADSTRERISLWVFTVLLYIPFLLALLVPFAILLGFSRCTEALEARGKAAEEQALTRATRARKLDKNSAAKARWVEEQFVQEEKTIEDISKQLSDIASRVKEATGAALVAEQNLQLVSAPSQEEKKDAPAAAPTGQKNPLHGSFFQPPRPSSIADAPASVMAAAAVVSAEATPVKREDDNVM